jgi:hypothetical protein
LGTFETRSPAITSGEGAPSQHFDSVLASVASDLALTPQVSGYVQDLYWYEMDFSVNYNSRKHPNLRKIITISF